MVETLGRAKTLVGGWVVGSGEEWLVVMSNDE